jgi:hypothetical protein
MSRPDVDKGLLPVPGHLPPGLKPGQPLHLALTWRGRDMRLYLDGQQIGRRVQATAFSEIPPGITLTVGDRRNRPARLILHAVRLSNIARSAQQFTDGEPTADIYTLLLDVFDRPTCINDDGVTSPQISNSLEGEAQGRAHGAWHFASNQPRAGVALFRKND